MDNMEASMELSTRIRVYLFSVSEAAPVLCRGGARSLL